MAGTMLRITTPDLRSMSQPAAIDPDISATLSDFLTYTEHLPSSVIRSMTLIETLNKKAYSLQLHIDGLLKTYGQLPNATADAPDPTQLRLDISKAYDKLSECKRMSAAESVRIDDMVAKEARRLTLVSKKLKTLPMPPSRDPTPEPVMVSPRLKRNNQAQQQVDKRTAAHRTSTAPRVRGRKIMVPGEVLPPPNPDSPPPSEPSDWGSPPPASPREQRPRHKSVGRPRTPKPMKPPREKVHKTPRIRPPGVKGTNAHSAVAGISTSNALSALQMPPPDAPSGSKWKPWKKLTEYELATIRKRMKKNAKWIPSLAMKNRELKELGRGQAAMDKARADAEAHGLPFFDEYDAAAWVDPTQGTITFEEQAEANAILGPEQEQEHLSEDQTMINRGMRLNEAKRIKREKLKAEEQAQTEQLQQLPAIPTVIEAVTDIDVIASSQTQIISELAASTGAVVTNGDRKRKRGITPVPPTVTMEPAVDSPDILSRPAPPPKKIKLNLSAPTPQTADGRRGAKNINQTSLPASSKPGSGDRQTNTTQPPPKTLNPPATSSNKSQGATLVPLAPAAPVTTKPTAPAPLSRPRSRRASAAPDPPLPPPPPTRSTRTTGPTITLKGLKGPKAASAEPPHRRTSLRRGSNVSLPGGASKLESPAPKPEPASRAGRRIKRPVPGLVTTEEGEGAKVSVGRRKAAPNKKKNAAAAAAPTQAAAKGAPAAVAPKKEEVPVVEEEPIDPDEPRYCVCGDVSWGTMIACDSDDVSLIPFPSPFLIDRLL